MLVAEYGRGLPRLTTLEEEGSPQAHLGQMRVFGSIGNDLANPTTTPCRISTMWALLSLVFSRMTDPGAPRCPRPLQRRFRT
jgi:hypothetical protein